MGSQGIRKGKPHPRRQPGGAEADPRANWELRNSPYTFEGEIEGLSRFGRGLSSASPGMRLAAKVVALLFIVPVMIGVLYWLFD